MLQIFVVYLLAIRTKHWIIIIFFKLFHPGLGWMIFSGYTRHVHYYLYLQFCGLNHNDLSPFCILGHQCYNLFILTEVTYNKF